MQPEHPGVPTQYQPPPLASIPGIVCIVTRYILAPPPPNSPTAQLEKDPDCESLLPLTLPRPHLRTLARPRVVVRDFLFTNDRNPPQTRPSHRVCWVATLRLLLPQGVKPDLLPVPCAGSDLTPPRAGASCSGASTLPHLVVAPQSHPVTPFTNGDCHRLTCVPRINVLKP